MTTALNTWNEPFLPWVESENDRRFRRILLITLTLFLLFGMIMPFLPVPEVERKQLQDVSPRLARLILEKKQAPPPPPPPKPKVEKKLPKKEQPKPAKKAPETKTPPKPQPSARKKAERTGLVALSDDLADLRESFDMAALDNKPQQKAGKQATVTTTSAILTAKATKGSGGINTGALNRSTGGSELATRSTTSVSSTIGNASGSNTRRSSDGRSAMRGEEEIERVFQKNKGAIFSIYNRALRKDPGLQGKVVLELTISPAGKVVSCKIISSELNDPGLEQKLISRVKLFKFAAKDVSQVTITYPIDFLPS
jgi:protein TonB